MSWLLRLEMWCSPQGHTVPGGVDFGTFKTNSILHLSLGKENPNNHERTAEKFKFGILRALSEQLQIWRTKKKTRKPGCHKQLVSL